MEQFTGGRQATRYFPDLYGKKTVTQLKRYCDLVHKFKKSRQKRFCYLASASGRVELIGNHTDHQGGRAVACTVNLDIIAAFVPTNDNRVRVCGNGYRDIVFGIDSISQVESGSIGLVKGVLAALEKFGYKVGGFDALLDSSLPAGMGMSSSAALETLVATIQNHLYNNGKIPPDILAKAGRYAENVYFQKFCGLLDQSVIAFGGILQMDFKYGCEVTPLGCDLLGLNIVVVNTGKSHSFLTQHFDDIVREMGQVAKFFGKEVLSQVNEEIFFAHFNRVKNAVGNRPALRAKHYFEENARTYAFRLALEEGNRQALLDCVNASGESSIYQLQNCNVGDDSTVADAVEFARKICPQCAARVHGGGFQGTVLALVEEKYLPDFLSQMRDRYGKNSAYVLRVRKLPAVVL